MAKLGSINKSGQIWGTDLVIAAVIFSVTLVFFYIYTFNQSAESEMAFESLSYEGGIITETLLSQGYPEEWNETNVVQLGVLSEGKINETKMEIFYNMSSGDYFNLKRILNSRYDFYFFLSENISLSYTEVDGIGAPGITRDNLEAEDIIKIERIVIYKNKPTTANLYVWD